MPADPDDTDALYARLQRDLERERGPLAWLRARPTPVRAGLLAAAALGAALGLVAWTGRWPAPRLDAALLGHAALLVLGALAVAAALRPIAERGDSPRGRAAAAGGLLLAGLGAVLVSGGGRWGAAGGWRCLLFGGALAVPVFAVSALLDRHPGRGALFGAVVAGLAGTLAVQLVCPTPELGHLVVGHFGVLLVSTALLGGLGHVVLRRRRG